MSVPEMDPEAFNAECYTRMCINEGVEYQVYKDSMGIPTVGIGFNLERADAAQALRLAGLDLQNVLAGEVLTDNQVEALFAYAWAPIIDEARASLDPNHYDTMTPARQFVLCDLVYNLGEQGWDSFGGTRGLINQACHNKLVGNDAEAHRLFGLAADHLTVSAWAAEVGNRAKRDIAMLRNSGWVDPRGDGTY